jgi:hypothetical protein
MASDAPNKVVTGKYAQTVTVSAPGPQGPAGLGAESIPTLVAYVHRQISALQTWTVVHNLDFFPAVTVYDSGETQCEGDVNHINNKSLTITFSAPISGKAHLS